MDMGANIGLVSSWFAVEYPNADVIAIEMDASNCAVLRANTERFDSRVRLVQAAAWTHEDGVPYDGSQNVDAFSVALPETAQTGEDVLVPSITPNSLIDMLGGRTLDVLKMDVEGAEGLLLLQGDLPLAKSRALHLC